MLKEKTYGRHVNALRLVAFAIRSQFIKKQFRRFDESTLIAGFDFNSIAEFTGEELRIVGL